MHLQNIFVLKIISCFVRNFILQKNFAGLGTSSFNLFYSGKAAVASLSVAYSTKHKNWEFLLDSQTTTTSTSIQEFFIFSDEKMKIRWEWWEFFLADWRNNCCYLHFIRVKWRNHEIFLMKVILLWILKIAPNSFQFFRKKFLVF